MILQLKIVKNEMNCLLCKSNELIKKENLICKTCYLKHQEYKDLDKYKLKRKEQKKIFGQIKYFNGKKFRNCKFCKEI
jgi:Zn finger protein HypA/HybF involved in hydrogenase expression